MNRSMESATARKCSRSHAPSNRPGIASNSAWETVTMPVTWLVLPSK
jgi:hypothetical protein